MTSVLHSLLSHLKLTKSYTLFLINPKKPVVDQKQSYGYRTGFSKTEIDYLYDLPNKVDILNILDSPSLKGKTPLEPLPPIESVKRNKTEQGKVQIEDFSELSLRWANWYVSTYQKNSTGSNYPQACAYAQDEEDKDIRCVSMSRVESAKIEELSRMIAYHGAEYERNYLRNVLLTKNVFDECLVDAWISHERFAFLDLSAGPFTWGTAFAMEGIKIEETIPRFPEFKVGGQNKDSPMRRQAQLTSLEAQYTFYCVGDDREQHQLLCDNLVSKMRKLNHEMEESEEEEQLDGNYAEIKETVNIKLDYWLADLASLISSSLRHVFSPGVPLYKSYFADRVVFDIFVFSDHNAFDPLGEGYVNIAELKKELLRFKLKQQEFLFNVKKISMSEDQFVAMAFQNSLKAATIPGVDLDGRFEPEEQLYIDSKEVRRQLKSMYLQDDKIRIEKDSRMRKKGSKVLETSRHIPIYLFSVNYDTPVLVDKYYLAKGLKDMVVAVQTNFGRYRTKLQCNNKYIHWNLQNPIKQILSAAALTLGGLVPPHISYSRSRMVATQNWLWSIGDNPFSHTTHSYRFGTLHKDLVFRNYIVNGIEDSLETVNHAIQLLTCQRTTHTNFEAFSFIPKQKLLDTIEKLRVLWKKTVSKMAVMKWEEAIDLLKEIEVSTSDFRNIIYDITTVFELFRCAPQQNSIKETPQVKDKEKEIKVPKRTPPKKRWHWLIPTLATLNVLAAVFYFLFRQKVTKIKIN